MCISGLFSPAGEVAFRLLVAGSNRAFEMCAGLRRFHQSRSLNTGNEKLGMHRNARIEWHQNLHAIWSTGATFVGNGPGPSWTCASEASPPRSLVKSGLKTSWSTWRWSRHILPKPPMKYDEMYSTVLSVLVNPSGVQLALYLLGLLQHRRN